MKAITVIIETSLGNMQAELYPEVAPANVENLLQLIRGEKEFVDPNKGRHVSEPYYDGVIFHRVVKDLFVQTGDRLGTGSGNPGFAIKDEINAKALKLDQTRLKDYKYYSQEAQEFLFKKMNINNQFELNQRIDEFRDEMGKIKFMTVEKFLLARGYSFDETLPSLACDKYTVAMANLGPNSNATQFFINMRNNPFFNGKHTVVGRLSEGFNVADEIAAAPCDDDARPLQDIVVRRIRIS